MPQIFIIPEEILNNWRKIVQYEPCNSELCAISPLQIQPNEKLLQDYQRMSKELRAVTF
jgi:hypothetical protein